MCVVGSLNRVLSVSWMLLGWTKCTMMLIAYGFLYTLDFLLGACAWIGMCITTLICGFFSGIFSLSAGIVTLIQVLLEDFEYFLQDTWSCFLGLLFSLCQIIEEFCIGWDRITWVPAGFRKFLGRILNYPILQDVLHFFRILNGSILLIGSIVWSIPQTTAVLIFEILRHIILIVILILELLTDLVIRVPYESALGFLTVLALFHLNKRYRLYKICWRMCRRTFWKSRTALKEALIYLQIITWMFKRGFASLLSLRSCEIPKRRSNYNLRELKKKVISSPSKIELIAQLEKEREQKLCVVCMDRQRNTMLLECRHICMCQTCALEIYTSTGDCPVCRKDISEFWTVFT